MIQIGNSNISDSVKFEVAEAATCIIDDGVEIRDFVIIECGDGGYIHIKKGVTINSHTWINASGKVTIGEDTLIGPNVSITSSSHRYALHTQIKNQGMQVSEVELGNDVWIGAGCTILPGVTIGDSSIVAANALVKYDIAGTSIAAGNPAAYIANRKYKTVIFYTLPLVIREQSTLFSSVVDVYKPLMDKFYEMGWRCVLVGSDELVYEYREDKFDLVSPDTFAIKYPDYMDKQWLSRWKKILTAQKLDYHSVFLEQLISEYSPSMFFCWNFDGLLKAKCDEKQVPIVFNELGLLRAPNPMAYYSDPQGVNTRSGLQSEFKQYRETIASNINYKNASPRLVEIENNYAYKSDIKSDYVLVLLQVQDDSNIMMGSPFESMQEYVTCISSALDNSPYRIIVKPHPLDEPPIFDESIVVAEKDADTSSLIGNAAAVFTINSSAGFEAALAGKTVYVLGNAPYSGLGITIDVDSPSMLEALWAKHGAEREVNRELRIQVIDFVYDYYFLSPEDFIDPSAHFSRLIAGSDVNNDCTRKGFVDEYEINRQQAYISHLEANQGNLLTVELDNVNKLNQKYREEICDLTDKKKQALEKVNEIEHLLYLTRQSISWRITRPLRLLRRMITEPNVVLRQIYHRLPILSPIVSKLRNIKHRVKHFSQSILDSQDNISAIQALSKRRVNYQLTNKVDCELPTIAISVVTFNSEKWIEQFFSSLLEQSYPLNKLNLLLVDNGSTDNTITILEGYKLKLANQFSGFSIFAGENIGFGAGHDVAIQASTEAFFLISNIDLNFTYDALKTVVFTSQSDVLNEVACWELRQAPYEHPKYYDPVTLETNWSSHACILVRREAYEKVKGYDYNIFMYGEDVELSYRFRSFGYHLKYCPKALVFHYTYEHESQVKPLQYKGSTLANFNIRLRYGNLWDKLAILILQLGLLSRPAPYPSARKDIIGNVFKLIKSAPHFLSGKGSAQDACFPLRMFDYEMIREGAFCPIGIELEQQPLVSVIVRTYKGRAEYLRQALISICNQTYSSIEIVVVEDGGNTHQELVEALKLNTDVNISYFFLGKVGRSVTGNYGLAQSKGKYCVFLDDDDLLFSDHVEVLVSELENNENAVAAYSLAMEVWTRQLDTQGNYQEEFFHTPEVFKQEFDYSVLQERNFIPIQSILFERRLFLERGGFEEDMSNLEDWNLWLRYGYNNNFLYVPKTTSLFRTPADGKVRDDRHLQLHQAYFIAKDRAEKSCQGYKI